MTSEDESQEQINTHQEQINRHVGKRTVKLPDGTTVPAIGQGTWRMGEDSHLKDQEVEALKLGVELGMTLIDTAEMYSEGGAEKIVSEALKGQRGNVFLVSKVYPHNAGLGQIAVACENSLRRLETDYLDLYLLHWRGRVPLEETVEGLEKLKQEGKIARWGVSNLDARDMEELIGVHDGTNCMTNQVLYHIGSRGIEYELLPWQRQHHIPVMAYCPLAQGGSLGTNPAESPAIADVARKHGASPYQILLAWSIRNPDIISIPKATRREHVLENAAAAAITLDEGDVDVLDQHFPPPSDKMPLDIV